MTNTTTAKTINTLETQRQTWEKNAFKKSNEELYQLLDDCLSFHRDLSGNPDLVKGLDEQLEVRKITFNKGTSLSTKIVRAVFGDTGDKRVFAYARVITVAAEDKNNNTMHDFIVAGGGIENIRRGENKAGNAAELRKMHQDLAEELLAERFPIATPISVANSSRNHNTGATSGLFVAIMREEADGTYSLVYETDKKSVIKTALAEAGEVLAKKRATKTVAKKVASSAVGNVNSTKMLLTLPASAVTSKELEMAVA